MENPPENSPRKYLISALGVQEWPSVELERLCHDQRWSLDGRWMVSKAEADLKRRRCNLQGRAKMSASGTSASVQQCPPPTLSRPTTTLLFYSLHVNSPSLSIAMVHFRLAKSPGLLTCSLFSRLSDRRSRSSREFSRTITKSTIKSISHLRPQRNFQTHRNVPPSSGTVATSFDSSFAEVKIGHRLAAARTCI